MSKLFDWLFSRAGFQNIISNQIEKQLNGKSIDYTNYSNDKIKIYNKALNKLWYSGNAISLESFYKKNYNPESVKQSIQDSSFWRWSNLEPSITKVHSAFPKSVSNYFSSLLFSSKPVLDVSTGNKSNNKILNKVIDTVLYENNIQSLLQSGAALESYSGGLAAKISLDSDFSDLPIIEFYPYEDIELNLKYSRIFEIIFKDVYYAGKKNYLLKSIYGYGYIKYRLYELDMQGAIKGEVSLNKIEETKNLKDIYIFNNDGKPLPVLMAVYKQNRSGDIYAASDYDGLSDSFNVLDSYESLQANYMRYGSKVKRVFTEDQLLDVNGKRVIPETWGIDAIVLKDMNPVDTKSDVQTLLPNLNITAFNDAICNVKKSILDKVGLSYSAFGLGNSGANEAAEALAIRKEANYKTRLEKLGLWEEFLQKLMRLVLIYTEISKDTPITTTDKIGITLSNSYDYNYIVRFAPYQVETDDEKSTRLKIVYENELMTYDDMIKEYYKDTLSEEEINQKIIELRDEFKNKQQTITTNEPPIEEV
nr:MAG TPA: portal protein [Caudoviricetes sp.]